MNPTDPQSDPWAEVERLTLLAQRSTFAIGDVWLSPGCHRFEVVHVSPDGVATMQKLGPSWKRTVAIRWNSPKLSRWSLLSPSPSPA
jgi:hypothetical protein